MAKLLPCGLYAATDDRPLRSFCGPTAIAALTGCSVVAAEDAILATRKAQKMHRAPNRKRGRVVTMWWHEAEDACKRLGWRVVESSVPYVTFAQWQRQARDPDARWLILLRGHFVAVRGAWFADTKHRNPVPLSTAGHRRHRVVRLARLEPMEG